LKWGLKITWLPGYVGISDSGVASAARVSTYIGNHVAVVLYAGLGLTLIRKEKGIKIGTSSYMASETCDVQ
jgi:hypothetical protein